MTRRAAGSGVGAEDAECEFACVPAAGLVQAGVDKLAACPLALMGWVDGQSADFHDVGA